MWQCVGVPPGTDDTQNASLVDKDVTVAIVKIEQVDSEKMEFLDYQKVKFWGRFFSNQLNKAAISSKGRFLTSRRAFDLLSDSTSRLEFFLKDETAFFGIKSKEPQKGLKSGRDSISNFSNILS